MLTEFEERLTFKQIAVLMMWSRQKSLLGYLWMWFRVRWIFYTDPSTHARAKRLCEEQMK